MDRTNHYLLAGGREFSRLGGTIERFALAHRTLAVGARRVLFDGCGGLPEGTYGRGRWRVSSLGVVARFESGSLNCNAELVCRVAEADVQDGARTQVGERKQMSNGTASDTNTLFEIRAPAAPDASARMDSRPRLARRPTARARRAGAGRPSSGRDGGTSG